MLLLLLGVLLDIPDPWEDELPPPDLAISAFNIGYKDSEGLSSQNYDFIELTNNSGAPLALADYSLTYENSAGTETRLSFPEGVTLVGDSLVLGYAKSPQYSDADDIFLYNFGSSGLAATGGTIRVLHFDEVVDELCWGSNTCDSHLGKIPTTEEQNFSYLRSGSSFSQVKYYPEIDPSQVEIAEPEFAICLGLEITEVFSYYENTAEEQFIEIQNGTSAPIDLNGCELRYKNKKYSLGDVELAPGEYLVYRPEGFSLTKDPTSSLTVELLDGLEQVVDSMIYSHGQKKGVSNMLASDGEWYQTYNITPGADNIFQEFQSCEEGKTINPETGKCVKEEEADELIVCAEGQYLNPETNRCKKIETAELTECKEGYERNPETNRCRKITSDEESSLAECKEGYERNPETNRCRKIGETDSSEYTPVNTGEMHSAPQVFKAGYALVAALIGGVAYIIYQYRKEIVSFFSGILAKFKRQKLDYRLE